MKSETLKISIDCFLSGRPKITQHTTEQMDELPKQVKIISWYLDVVIHSYLIYFIHLFIYRSSWIDKTNNSRSFSISIKYRMLFL